MRRGRGDIVQLDEIDTRILRLLAADPRASNVALGAQVGVSDETVAARLRKLLEAGALAMTVLVDWQVAGYGVHAFVRLETAHGTPSEAVSALVRSNAPHLVAVTTGACDVVVGLLAADLVELRQQVVELVRSLDLVTSTSIAVVTEACRHDLHATTLPLQGWSLDLLTRSTVPLDELDLRLIDLLVSNAHESNRWLARRLDVSDGTVRARLQRLEEAGLIRIAAVYDTVTVGEIGAAAFVFIDVAGPDDAVVAALMSHPNIGTLDRCIGDSSLVVVATAPTENELHAFVSAELRKLKGVARVEVAFAVEALHHKANLVRLL